MMGIFQKLEETRIDSDPILASTFMSGTWSLDVWKISVAVRNQNCRNLLDILHKLANTHTYNVIEIMIITIPFATPFMSDILMKGFLSPRLNYFNTVIGSS